MKSAALALFLLLGLLAPREASAQFNGCAPGFCGAYAGAPTAPTVASVSPNSGTIQGGTSVAIGGTNYGTGGAAVTAVKFGATPAASFSCSSPTACTATSPAALLATDDITVTTAGGTSPTSAADHYTYVAGCTPSGTYLAALSGLSLTEQNADDAAVCALNTAGYLTRMDAFYIHASANAANARINAVNPSALAITTHGSCTFTVDRGFTGDGSSCYQDPGFNPSTHGGNYALNGATWDVCILNNRTATSGTFVAFGGRDATPNTVYFEALFTGGTTASSLNDGGGGAPQPTSTSSQGDWTIGRSSSAGFSTDLNGSALVNTVISSSASLPNVNLLEMAFNDNGSVVDFTTDQHAVWWFGGVFSGAEFTAIHNIVHTLTAALGASGC